ncbi:MAG: hypothetical protein LBH21_02030 [Gracilibacteraceae bacterium]|jgi:hypothetical protein|nr:hypothetical protein [Gracilibacteraceae bacterium]
MVQPIAPAMGNPSPAYAAGQGEFAGKAAPTGLNTVRYEAEEVPRTQDAPLNLTRKADNDSRQNATRECQTCKTRKYVDGSDDPGVSFKTPTELSPEEAATAVRAHEQEHVGRERAEAEREDREVISQAVILHTAVCPECGAVYVSGGTTTTVTREGDSEPVWKNSFQTGGEAQAGEALNAKA